jgi:PAS domain S-box-containing protein
MTDSPLLILYVDIEPLDLSLYRDYLETQDVIMEIAESGNQALQKITGSRFDAIVSEYQIPGMDGIEFLKEVRRREPDIPIILFTGHDREEVVIKAIENGADFYVQRRGKQPPHLKELTLNIKAALKQRKEKKALRESELRFQSLIQNSSVIIRILDKDGKIIFDSPSSSIILGYPEGSLIGSMTEDYIHPEDQERVKSNLLHLSDTHNTYIPIVYRIRKPDGTYLYVESCARNLTGISGVEGIIITIRPIQNQILADDLSLAYEKLALQEKKLRQNYSNLAEREQALAKSEELFRNIIERSSDLILILDHNFYVTYASPSSYDITGYTPEDLIGKSPDFAAATLFSQGGPEFINKIQRVRKGEPFDNIETWISKKDGTRAFINMYAIPNFQNGILTGVQVLIRDITKGKNNEIALRESKEKFQALVEHSLDGTLIIDPRGNILFATNSAAQIIDEDNPDDLIGRKNVMEFISPESREEVIRDFSKVADGIDGFIARYKIITMKQEERWVESIGKMIPFQGSPAIIISIRNITDRKRYEMEIAHKNDELQATLEKLIDTEDKLKEQIKEISLAQFEIEEREQKYRQLFEESDVGIALHEIICDYDGVPIDYRFLDVNPAFEKLTGLYADTIIGKTVLEVLPGTESYWIENYGHVALTKKTLHFEDYSRELRKYFEITAYSPKNGQFATLVQDISEKRRTEIHLRETNAYLDNLISNANVPIIVWDPTFHITRINHSCELLIGRLEQDVIQKPISILFPPEQIESSMRLIQTTLDGVRWDTLKIEIQHLDGSIKSVIWNSSTIYSLEGNTPIATIAQGRDVTSEKLLEMEKETATLQIQENIAKLAILNDGIRNPLSIILFYTEQMASPEIADKIQAEIRKINEMVFSLDTEWIRSVKILEFLRKHGNISEGFIPSSSPVRKYGVSHLENIAGGISRVHDNNHYNEEIQAQLSTILDSMDVFIYVADMETYDLLFLNKVGKSMYGDILGKKCYTSIQKEMDEPCPFCPNHLLISSTVPTGVYIWEYHDVHSNRWFECHDQAIRWTDGRMAKLEIATDITKRRRVEESLRFAQEKFTKVFLHSPSAIIISELKNGKIVEINNAASQVYGYVPEEMYGKSALDLGIWLNVQDRDGFYSHIRSKGRIESYELVERRKSGELFNALVSAETVSLYNKKYLISTIRDITESKRNEKALRESEEKFRALVEKSLDGTAIIDFAGNILFVNQRLGEILGHPDIQDLVGNFTIFSFIRPEFHENVIRDMNNVKSGMDNNIVIYQISTPDGREIWIECTGKKISYNGSPSLLVSIHDITNRKKSEDALRESERKLGIIFRDSPVTLSVVSLEDGVFTDVNEAFVKNTGYPREKVIGTTAELLGLFPDPDRYLEMTLELRDQKVLSGFDIACRNASGEIRYNQFSSRIIMIDGRSHVLSFIEDITERRETKSAFDAVVKSMVGSTGINSLQKITQNVSSWMNADCVMIGEIQPDNKTVTVLSMLLDGKEVSDFTYTLTGTPCEDVTRKGFCIFPDDAALLFPESKDLRELNIRGYIGTPLRNSEGKVFGILCVLFRNPVQHSRTVQEIIDIIAVKAAAEIERTQIEKTLRDNQEMLAEAMDLANLVSWEYDVRKDLFMFDDRFYALYGTTAEREGGHYMPSAIYAQRFCYPDDQWMVEEEVLNALNTTDPGFFSQREHRIIRRDGEIRHIVVRIRITKDAEGRTIKTHGANQDITERRRSEEVIRKANRQINLLSGITRHDILNKVSILYTYLESARFSFKDPGIKDFLDKMEYVVKDIQSQIEFTRIYEKLGSHEPQWLPLETLIPYSSVPAGITLSATDLRNISIHGDPMVKKVFLNLLDNSIRHGQRVTDIRVNACQSEKNLMVRWEDNGIGIANEEKELIFERGFGKNTGYGMFLAREILSLTGITIRETGIPGEGARIEILVPEGTFRRDIIL